MKMEAGFLARQAAEHFGNRVAISYQGTDQTFADLNATANRAGSALLRLGLARGDRVGVLSYNQPAVVQAWLGCEKHNLVRVVLHTHFDMDAHAWSLNHLEAKALLFDTRFSEQVAAHRDALTTVTHFVAIGDGAPDWAVPFSELVQAGDPADPFLDVDEDTPCFLQLTSGTTGHPKAWVKTYRSWQAVINHNLHHLDTHGAGVPAIGPDDVNVHFHPIQWASGFQTLYPYLIRGARSVLVDDETFDPDVLIDTFISEGATGTFMPGPLLTPVLDAIEKRGGIEHSLVRMVIFFGTPDLLKRTTRILGPIWSHGFGSTEQGAVTTRLLPQEVAENPERLNSVGRPGSPFLEIAIVDDDGSRLPPGNVGEIVVRSPMSLGAYWGMPDRTSKSFFPGDWFRPFDVGYLDRDGFLYYADRAGDKIVTSRGVVFPHLVEATILRHSAAANCGVVGLGAEGSQVVVAAVQLKAGFEASPEMEAELLTDAAEGLNEHERPSSVIFLTELPTVLGGAKVQRQALREQLQSRLHPQVTV